MFSLTKKRVHDARGVRISLMANQQALNLSSNLPNEIAEVIFVSTVKASNNVSETCISISRNLLKILSIKLQQIKKEENLPAFT